MKKNLLVTAALVASGVASAQSSVTLFGVLDATLAHGSGSVASLAQLKNSGNANSRLGFRGVEDLGGGLSASFWLEMAVNNDDGSGLPTNTNNQTTGVTSAGGLTFGRRSTVSLAGRWGELRLGRDFNPQFWNLTVFDPFATVGAGGSQMMSSIITGPTAVRSSNGVGYFLPGDLGGVYGQFTYYLGENASGAPTSHDGTGLGVRLGYAKGPLNVALATSRTEYAAGDVRQSNAGGEWNFGVAKLHAQFSRDGNGSLHGRGALIGSVIPVGTGEIRASFSRYRTDAVGSPSTHKLALGYVHNLSKRTAIYTTVARLQNNGGASANINGGLTSANGSSRGFDLGIRHSF